MTPEPSLMHRQFVHALQHEPIQCATAGCSGPVEVHDLSQIRDRVKVFETRCQRCGWRAQLSGREQLTPPWDDAAILVMADEHLMHQQPSCPFDGTPVVFTSLPNPRRRARYRLSCYYCGRQVEMDWPPPEARR
jgi:ribosomal protein S14